MSTQQESTQSGETPEPAGHRVHQPDSDSDEDTIGNPALARTAAHVHNTANASDTGSERFDGTSSTLGDGGGMSGGSVLDSGSGV